MVSILGMLQKWNVMPAAEYDRMGSCEIVRLSWGASAVAGREWFEHDGRGRREREKSRRLAPPGSRHLAQNGMSLSSVN
ncbi:hypothetical protein G6L34_21360 [Agrobacterium tumefaciens]|nr:hypothetical protein [Agrobacterium tumefaciens]